MPRSQSPQPLSAARRQFVLGALGILAVAGGGFLIMAFGNNDPIGFDRPWHDFLVGDRSTFANWLALALNTIGGTLGMTIITALVVAYLLFRRLRLQGLSLAVTVIAATLVSNAVKGLIDRPRPADETLALGAHSFPSGHVTVAAAFTVALALAFPQLWTRTLAVAWISLMAWSRNYLLVHWLSDVVAGAVLGIAVALLVAGGQPLIRRRAPATPSRRAR